VGIEVEQLPDELRARGLRVTAPRLAVFRAVAETPDIPTSTRSPYGPGR